MASQNKLSNKELYEIFPEMPQVLQEKMLEEAEAVVDAEIKITDSLLHAIREPNAKPICEAVIEIIEQQELIPHRKNLKRLRWQYESVTSGKQASKKRDPKELKNQISLKEICEDYGLKLRKSGKRWLTNCPFHQDRHPSFVIYPDDTFHCFSCTAHGDIFTFLQLKEGLYFKQSLNVFTRYKHGKNNSTTSG